MPAAKPSFPTLRRGHPLAQGLVAGWPLCEGGGLAANDLSGQGNSGAFSGGPTWAAGQSGWCLSSAAGSERVDVAARGLPSAALSPLTISFWHYTRAVVSLSQVFGFGEQLPGSSSSGGNRYVLQFSGDYYWWAGNADWDTLVAWDVGAWHHIAFTFDGANLRLYRDGALAAGPSSTNVGLYSTPGQILTAFGRHSSGTTSPNMLLDAAAVHNRALTQAEIAALAADSWAVCRRRSWRLKAASGGTVYTIGGQGGALGGSVSAAAWAALFPASGGALAGPPATPAATFRPAGQGGAAGGSGGSSALASSGRGGALGGSVSAAPSAYAPAPSGGGVAGSTVPAGCGTTYSLLFARASAQYVSLPSGPVAAGAFTVCGWVKLNSTGLVQALYSQGTGDHIQARVTAANQFAFSFDGSNVDAASPTLSASTWYHVAATYAGSGANQAQVYVNGTLGGSFTRTASYVSDAGRLANFISATGLSLDGLLADWRVYSVAKSGAQVAAIAAGTNDTASLLDHWPFAEGSGTTTADTAGSLTGTLVSGVTWSTDAPSQIASTGGVCAHYNPAPQGGCVGGSGATVPGGSQVLAGQGGAVGGSGGGISWAALFAPAGGALGGSASAMPTAYAPKPSGGAAAGSSGAYSWAAVAAPSGGTLAGSRGSSALAWAAAGGGAVGSGAGLTWVAAVAASGGGLGGAQADVSGTTHTITVLAQGGAAVGSACTFVVIASRLGLFDPSGDWKVFDGPDGDFKPWLP